ncbi:MAG: hypothetical protein COV74_05565 [Candidatus Omnitrophica bacterium CG11_big_fil_rev_8_21_14_0_20_45_26]|uniref:Phosphatidic acid phosphatase type 2/haloperoxidase domain-containing protein n=1 Tax=Candidatus Abzuiibacterium crystallinum TaxID=1974748 RepID=A0A2H0LPG3_9BACT|nr:MAG: hypothetical protein COV74_05565 [Candidatus Omnitrophica bacterium CG11_big_fil_rev_8_21_14_0_20_45_26]PIW63194.1 MAG: hypothetical protein COW12_11395 [Candidatus Omnitrophica bacterium CG12_big_fil_rev_8_21_14_0_65_45_16]
MTIRTKVTQNRYLLGAGAAFLIFAFVCLFPITKMIDQIIIDWVQHVHWEVLDRILAVFVAVGSVQISVTGLFILSIIFYKQSNYRKAYLLIAGLLLLTMIEFVMKHFFPHHVIPASYVGRYPWASVAGHLELETPFSFPSGHSMRSAFFLGTLYLGIPVFHRRSFLYLILVYLAGQAVAMNNFGFHWLSDCLAGYWLAGLAIWTIEQVESAP